MTSLLPFAILVFSIPCVATHQDSSSRLFLVSIDGYGWNYTAKARTPNIDAFIKSGVKAEYMIPCFPTLTFPTHYSMATGLYAESHGVVGNRMYDPLFDEIFKMSTTDTKWWDGGVPVWTSAVLQGLQVGFFFWPGSSVKLRNVRPNAYREYDYRIKNKERIDTAVSWLVERHYDLAGIYFESVDYIGHKYGPDSKELKLEIEKMDEQLGYLMDQLELGGIGDVNVIIVSDHGMAEVDTVMRVVNLTACIDPAMIKFAYSGVQVSIFPERDNDTEIIYQALHGCHPHMRAYRKAEIPDVYHYKNNRRVGPIMVVADNHWYISYDKTANVSGYHGYDNRLPDMRAVFMARGPRFLVNTTIPPIKAVDLYPLMCEILGITPEANNGSLSATASALAPDMHETTETNASARMTFDAGVLFIALSFWFTSKL